MIVVLADPRQVKTELTQPLTISAYGALSMVYILVVARVAAAPVALDSVAVARVAGSYVFAVAQALLLLWFIWRCQRLRLRPEPFWNPPTINCALTAIVGAQVGAASWVVIGSFGLAIVLQVVLVPVQVWRVMRSREVSSNISVAMMQAPSSLNALMWTTMRRNGVLPAASWLPASADTISHVRASPPPAQLSRKTSAERLLGFRCFSGSAWPSCF